MRLPSFYPHSVTNTTRLLSDVKIVDMASLTKAIQALHSTYRVPHVVITSVNFANGDGAIPSRHLAVVGSSMAPDGSARLFKIVFPSIDCYFSGTGDVFGALVTARMREAVRAVPGLSDSPSWLSGGDVAAVDLPLARAVEKVLGSMHDVLTRTRDGMQAVVAKTNAQVLTDDERTQGTGAHQIKSKAAELRLVQNLECLQNPRVLFKAEAL